MSHTAAPRSTHLQSRYGKAQKQSFLTNKRTVITTATVLIAGALVWAGSLTFFRDSGPVNPQNVTFTIDNAGQAESTFSVVPDPERDISCSVVAKNQYEAIVGYAEITVPANPSTDGQTPQVVKVPVNTVQRAHQGHLEGCRFIG